MGCHSKVPWAHKCQASHLSTHHSINSTRTEMTLDVTSSMDLMEVLEAMACGQMVLDRHFHNRPVLRYETYLLFMLYLCVLFLFALRTILNKSLTNFCSEVTVVFAELLMALVPCCLTGCCFYMQVTFTGVAVVF